MDAAPRSPESPKFGLKAFWKKSSPLPASQQSPRVTSDTPPQHWLTSVFKGQKSAALPSFHTDVIHPQETLSPCIVRVISVRGSQPQSESKKEIKGRGGKEQLWQNEKKWRLGKLHTQQSFKMVFFKIKDEGEGLC